MPDKIDELFGSLTPPGEMMPAEQSPNYPGSKKVRAAVARQRSDAAARERWDYRPYRMLLGGVMTDFFTSGHLARALGYETDSIRKWEHRGHIPESDYRLSSESKNGRRRLYTREQIEGIVKIAREEGLMSGRKVSNTNFRPRVAELFSSGRKAKR